LARKKASGYGGVTFLDGREVKSLEIAHFKQAVALKYPRLALAVPSRDMISERIA
jgi:hypothetical protein